MSLANSVCTPIEELIHGVLVRDPYRWLENRDLPETEEWICDQHRRREEYFESYDDFDALRTRVREYLDVEVIDQPTRVAGRYIYRRRKQGQEQPCIYVRDVSTTNERLLVDPSQFGEFASVAIHCVSEDGSLLAFELKSGGEDRKTIHLVDMKEMRILPDKIATGYARGFTFISNGTGFYYCHETPTELKNHTIQRHLFGESARDTVVFSAARTDDSRLVLLSDTHNLGALWMHTMGSERVADLWIARRDDTSQWRRVFTERELLSIPILKHGRIFSVSYNKSPNGRLIELTTDGDELRTIVPEQNEMIQQCVVSDEIFISYRKSESASIRLWSLLGRDLGKIDVSTDGTLHLLSHKSQSQTTLFYTYESFTQPLTTFEYVPETGRSLQWHQPILPTRRTPPSVLEVSFLSKDGVRIPMKLIGLPRCKRALETAVIMTSYGGFGFPVTPQFSIFASILIERGAVFALPQIRGGGDFGKVWHDGGRGKNRQTAFDDFLAAAEWLCREKITSPAKLGIFGGSNSGLLVGAAMTQRPDLFGAVLCIAPLLDMVRYEHFDQALKWRKEYGSTNFAEDFTVLHEYSPYHRVQNDTNYPSVLFVSGDKDDRCNPAHVRKMAAHLQAGGAQTRPILVDYSGQRGHAPVLPLSVRIDALTRRIAFMWRELNVGTANGDIDEHLRA
jgi:prolyl oligopeptidase